MRIQFKKILKSNRNKTLKKTSFLLRYPFLRYSPSCVVITVQKWIMMRNEPHLGDTHFSLKKPSGAVIGQSSKWSSSYRNFLVGAILTIQPWSGCENVCFCTTFWAWTSQSSYQILILQSVARPYRRINQLLNYPAHLRIYDIKSQVNHSAKLEYPSKSRQRGYV